MSKLIFCKFLDEVGNPRGRDYTYKTDIEVQPGDYVLVEVVRGSESISTKKVVVTKTDLTPDDIPGYENFKDSIKSILGPAPDEETEKDTSENAESVPEIDMEDL